MARNSKVDTDPTQAKDSLTVHGKLDNETMHLWNIAKKHHNMSEWLRAQLRFHFGKNLTPSQKGLLLREEMAIAAREKAAKITKAEETYFATIKQIQRQFSTDEVAIIVAPEEHDADNI